LARGHGAHGSSAALRWCARARRGEARCDENETGRGAEVAWWIGSRTARRGAAGRGRTGRGGGGGMETAGTGRRRGGRLG
jgi:hypothetical protein